MSEPLQDPRREPIWRLIRRLMLLDLALGLFLLAFAGPVFGLPGLGIAGAVLAAIGAGLYLFFGRLAERARHAQGE